MGAGSSTPADSSKHVFTSDTPISFSPELIESLQSSSETNSSRAKSIDLHIAQRVREELAKVEKQEASRWEALRSKILSGESDKPEKKPRQSGILELPSLSAKDLFSGESEEEKKRKSQSSANVQGEIDKLKKALGERKKLKDIPEELDKARGDLIACLRIKDRQPLDCWKEVEVFKREVRKLESQFVADTL